MPSSPHENQSGPCHARPLMYLCGTVELPLSSSSIPASEMTEASHTGWMSARWLLLSNDEALYDFYPGASEFCPSVPVPIARFLVLVGQWWPVISSDVPVAPHQNADTVRATDRSAMAIARYGPNASIAAFAVETCRGKRLPRLSRNVEQLRNPLGTFRTRCNACGKSPLSCTQSSNLLWSLHRCLAT